MGRLDGRTAIVTGGASGIGAASVRLFHGEGARVIAADLQEERAKALAEELGEGVLHQRADVSREEDVAALVQRATSEWGRLDVMFNNAGIGGVAGRIEEIRVEDFDSTVGVLLRGVFLGMKHAARVMRPQREGSIISTASVAGLRGVGPHVYCAAKAAVIHLTRSVSLELGEDGVRVNCICPGGIVTPLITSVLGGTDEAVRRVTEGLATTQPIPRAGQPEDIARAALWLASDESSFVNGEALVVDGGMTAGRRWSEQAVVSKAMTGRE